MRPLPARLQAEWHSYAEAEQAEAERRKVCAVWMQLWRRVIAAACRHAAEPLLPLLLLHCREAASCARQLSADTLSPSCSQTCPPACTPQVVVAARPAALEAEEAELEAMQVRQQAADTQFHAEVGAGVVMHCCSAVLLGCCSPAAGMLPVVDWWVAPLRRCTGGAALRALQRRHRPNLFDSCLKAQQPDDMSVAAS